MGDKEVVEEDMDAASIGSGSSDVLVVEHSVPANLSIEDLRNVGMRKRLRSATRSCSESAESALSDEEAPATKVGKARRGRGRPPTTGQYVGLAKAKADLLAIEKEELKVQAEKELAAMAKTVAAKAVDVPLRPAPGAASSSSQQRDWDDASAEVLAERIKDSCEVIEWVAKKSGNLKGTFTKALKEATITILKSTFYLRTLSFTDETARLEETIDHLRERETRLKAEYMRLQGEDHKMRDEIEALKVEVEVLKRQAPPATQAPPAESELLRLFRQEMAGLTARFAVLEGKMLRPPLAGDRRVTEETQPTAASYAAKAATSRASAPTQEPKPTALPKTTPAKASQPQATKQTKTAPPKASKPQVAKQAKIVAPEASQAQPTTSQSQAQSGSSQAVTPKSQPKGKGKKPPQEAEDAAANSTEGEWQTVQKKKSTTKKKKQPTGKKSQKKKAVQLREPNTTAIVLALQPEAEKKGVTYASMLTEAKRKINLADLGIASLGYKRAVTGARILVIPGATSGDKADSLAAKLRECLSGEDVRVSRPSKCAEMRVSGLDDSVTKEELCATAARVGGCTPDEVKVGEIRLNTSGEGTAWLRCPVGAAKKIAGAGRLLVGWVSAKVTLLEPRPMQCHRCLQGGHVQHSCSSEVDRSGHCYRCSQPGHVATQCTAEPHCSLCAAAGKRANHRVGGKACKVAKQKGRANGKAPRPTQSSATQAMDVTESASAPPS